MKKAGVQYFFTKLWIASVNRCEALEGLQGIFLGIINEINFRARPFQQY